MIPISHFRRGPNAREDLRGRVIGGLNGAVHVALVFFADMLAGEEESSSELRLFRATYQGRVLPHRGANVAAFGEGVRGPAEKRAIAVIVSARAGTDRIEIGEDRLDRSARRIASRAA